MSVVAGKITTSNKEMENKMVKVALVVSVFILGMFSLVISNSYSYLSLITNETENATLAGQWSLIGAEFFVGAFVLALGFIIHSRKK